ncbi:MAG TPA: metallophosphoesterase [Allosphingosinicella sp.]|nr:metallophosphoesterase [Allosphingosinicella sp.]
MAGLMMAVFPSVGAMPQPQRIVAIGDLHGDYGAWRDIAHAAGLVDRDGHWTGRRTILVQTGDVVDRGPDSLKIIRDIRRLGSEASRAGGRVIALVGNHEAMNITGDLRYVHSGEFAAFRGPDSASLRKRYFADHHHSISEAWRRSAPSLTDREIRAAWERSTPLGFIEHRQAWHPTGEIGAWVIRNPAAVKLDGLVFVHGGLSSAYSKLSLREINNRVGSALSNRDARDNAIINDPSGPLWYRGLIRREESDQQDEAIASAEEELAAVLHAYQARAIVVGHTPNLSGIKISNGGRLARIDTGISQHYGGRLTYLEVIGGRLIPRAVERSTAREGGR